VGAPPVTSMGEPLVVELFGTPAANSEFAAAFGPGVSSERGRPGVVSWPQATRMGGVPAEVTAGMLAGTITARAARSPVVVGIGGARAGARLLGWTVPPALSPPQVQLAGSGAPDELWGWTNVGGRAPGELWGWSNAGCTMPRGL